MKWRNNQSTPQSKRYFLKVVSVCLLLIILPYSCSKTATGMWVGAGLGAAALTPIGYLSLSEETCYSCSTQEHLSNNVYTMIGMGVFGFILGGIIGGVFGNHYEEKEPLHPIKKNKKAFNEIIALKKLYLSAIQIGDANTLDKLLTKHPRFASSIDEDGLTGLHKTAMLGYKEASQVLLIHGVNINGIDNKGRTPLHYAAIHKQLNIYQYLIQEGADVSIKDSKNKTAVEYLGFNNQEYKKLFKNSFANTNATILAISNSAAGLTNQLNLKKTN